MTHPLYCICTKCNEAITFCGMICLLGKDFLFYCLLLSDFIINFVR